jgi:hypothetical protein
MANFTAPRSDQTNFDDFAGGPKMITITGVRANEGSREQPISISYQGDEGKPYKPCLSMRRVLVYIWGADASKYVGRSMTLYGDPDVQFGGLKVGGIRISHMSHIDEPKSMPLTTTRARRALFTVQPLVRTATDAPTTATATKATPTAASATASAAQTPPTLADYAACKDAATFEQLEQRRADNWKKVPTADKPKLKEASDAAGARLREPKGEPFTLDGAPPDREAGAIAALEAAYKNGQQAVAEAWAQITTYYAEHKADVPMAVEAKFGEINEAMKE